MNYLTETYLPGTLALWCSLFFLLLAMWAWIRHLESPQDGHEILARQAYRFFALSVLATSLVLVFVFVTRNYGVEYVFQHSGNELAWFFQFSAFWAGQKGSFLMWLLCGALIGWPLMKKTGELEAPTMLVYCLTLLGLLAILVRQSPFILLPVTPLDGNGLNPLLQDYWMVIHPPIMFLGYAASAIPFAFAIAALWTRKTDHWAALAFPWTLAGFLVLGTAILLGGYWAYKTLGWGGYWGWDPVENASLIPWILGTVLIHGLYMERSKGRFRRANYLLACLVYLSVLYGTFLTRSGVLADFSVHSFVDLGLSAWLVGLMAVFGLLAILALLRIREISTGKNEDPLFSRGSFLIFSTITLFISAVVITVGTSAPLLTRWKETPGQVGPSFYNTVNLPIALAIAFLLAAVPFLTWKGRAAKVILREALWPSGLAVLVLVISLALGVRHPLHLLFIFLAALAAWTNLYKTFQRARAGGLGSTGGYLAHVGVGIILLGFLASSAYDESTKLTLEQGNATEVGDLSLTFTRFLPGQGQDKDSMEVQIQPQDGDPYLVYPKLFVHQRTGQVMAQPDIKKNLLADIYVSPIQLLPGEPPGGLDSIKLQKGESTEIAGTIIQFEGFDLTTHGDAMEQMNGGGDVAIGATLKITQEGSTQSYVPQFSFNPSGRQTSSPPTELAGGGSVAIQAIDATSGAVQLTFLGLDPTAAQGTPARLSIDLTRKPLIKMVWYGLYVVLAGGLLASLHRLKQVKVLESIQR